MTQTTEMTTPADREWLSVYLFFNGWIYDPACDRVVVDVVEPFVRRCQREGWVDQHFYIRYSEFGPHVRLRFLGRPDVLAGEVWPALVEHLRAHNPAVEVDARPEQPSVPQRGEGDPVLVTHVARVEYEPETERYGGPDALRVSERVFEVSSDAAYALTAKMTPERSSRLGKGLLSMVVLVHVFCEQRERGAAFSQMYSTNYLRSLVREEGGRDAWMEAFDQGFSQQSETLVEYVDAIWEAMDDGDSLSDTLDAYADGMRRHRDALRALFDAGRVQVMGETATDWQRAVSGIAPSYVHMMNNRLGITLQEESYLGYLITRALGRPAEALRTSGAPPAPEPAPAPAQADA
ncbi:thiopeptide-type bacteriocin biosynthesis protein [Longimicrobium sp.]|uniref:thiopeptide-type bacteriocin biosynthesis protein n=1 Tax=Longimicrobium sp. TaxID=2029185 RepID=UPI002E3296A7|nr:thiopeptide-type bacteriocin biosynthesis protein [Longimicrobium sp.]